MIFLYTILTYQTPIVLMHGMAANKERLLPVVQIIKEVYPNTYVLNCEVGNGIIDSVMMTVKDSVEELSKFINDDVRLKDGFVVFAFSQGGYLLRNYIQNYNHIRFPVLRFVGMSNPLGGFYCGKESKCFPLIQILVDIVPPELIYTEFIQNLITASNYWRDPQDLEDYVEKALDLPLLDNLRSYDEQRKINFMSVDQYILFGSPNDGLISPWKSAFFGQWGKNDSQMLNFWERDDYEADNFGLKSMHQQNRIKMFETTFKHGEYLLPHAKKYLVDNVIPWLDINKK